MFCSTSRITSSSLARSFSMARIRSSTTTGAGDGEHLLLAAGKLIAGVGEALGQLQEEVEHRGHGPMAFLFVQ